MQEPMGKPLKHFNKVDTLGFEKMLYRLLLNDYYGLASFPGPAQLSVACSTVKRGEPGIFSHVNKKMTTRVY